MWNNQHSPPTSCKRGVFVFKYCFSDGFRLKSPYTTLRITKINNGLGSVQFWTHRLLQAKRRWFKQCYPYTGYLIRSFVRNSFEAIA
nr:MAG TPA: hypothetical protein [Caudoviricetes sp.]